MIYIWRCAVLENMRKELKELSGKIERKNKIESMLLSLKQEEIELIEKEYELRSILAKENNDVERLKNTSVTSIFYSMLGKKEQQLEKELQEAFAAKLKYDAALRQKEHCSSRKEILLKEQQELNDCEDRFQQVFSEIQILLHNNPEYAEKLCKLERQLGEVTNQIGEVDEAIAVGNACIFEIKNIEDSLSSAEGWGTWDLMGGGMISAMAKHSDLDKAQNSAEHLQVLLSSFRTELADVKIYPDMGQVNIDGFLRFADYFFDGLIADWSVLSRIHDSQKSVSQVANQVSLVLAQLEKIHKKHEVEKASLEDEIARLVFQA